MTSNTDMTVSVTGDTYTSYVGSVVNLDAASEDKEVQEVKRKTFVGKMLLPRRTDVGQFVFYTPSLKLSHVHCLLCIIQYGKKSLYNRLLLLHVTPGPNEKPAKGFSWGDYEDVHVPVLSSLGQPSVC